MYVGNFLFIFKMCLYVKYHFKKFQKYRRFLCLKTQRLLNSFHLKVVRIIPIEVFTFTAMNVTIKHVIL